MRRERREREREERERERGEREREREIKLILEICEVSEQSRFFSLIPTVAYRASKRYPQIFFAETH